MEAARLSRWLTSERAGRNVTLVSAETCPRLSVLSSLLTQPCLHREKRLCQSVLSLRDQLVAIAPGSPSVGRCGFMIVPASGGSHQPARSFLLLGSIPPLRLPSERRWTPPCAVLRTLRPTRTPSAATGTAPRSICARAYRCRACARALPPPLPASYEIVAICTSPNFDLIVGISSTESLYYSMGPKRGRPPALSTRAGD